MTEAGQTEWRALQNCVHTTGKLWMGESNVRVAWVLAVNYGRRGCARDTTADRWWTRIINWEGKGREADRRSPFIPRHDDIMTRRDCIESFISPAVYTTSVYGSIAPVAAIRRLAVNIERPGVIRRAIKITILSHEAGLSRIAPSIRSCTSPPFEQG